MESDPALTILLICLVLSFLLSSIFSVVKIIFYSIDSASIPADNEYLRFSASKVETILKNESLFKNTVSFGRTFSNVFFTVLLSRLLFRFFPEWSLLRQILYTGGISVFVLSLFANNMVAVIAKPFYISLFSIAHGTYTIFSWLFLPIVALFTLLHNALLKLFGYDERLAFLSEEEKARIAEKNGDESLESEEKEMIQGIFDLSETTVEEIMVPRINMIGIEQATPLSTILDIVKNEAHSRLPVYKETIDSIVGILYVKDILSWLSEHLSEEWNVTSLIKKPFYVPVGKKVNDLMHDFKRKHIHLAVVVDEYGGTAGLVTMEDILEEIVGDIQDEYDQEEKEVIKIGQNSYLVDPYIDIDDLNDELDIHLEVEDAEYNTLSGLIYHELGAIPHENVSVKYDCLNITVLKMDNQRIEKVKVEIIYQNGNGKESATF